jgi:hypothetical protein
MDIDANVEGDLPGADRYRVECRGAPASMSS